MTSWTTCLGHASSQDTHRAASGGVRVASRSIPPPWRSIRFRPAPRTYAPWGVRSVQFRPALGTYAPWGCIVRVASQTQSRKIPTRNKYHRSFSRPGSSTFTRWFQVCTTADDDGLDSPGLGAANRTRGGEAREVGGAAGGGLGLGAKASRAARHVTTVTQSARWFISLIPSTRLPSSRAQMGRSGT